MNNVDKAKEYAEGKINDALNKVIVQAYMAGYNSGYQDGYDKVVKETSSDDIEYVDLGLPSGTLWSSNYLEGENNETIYVLQEKSKAFDIPTVEQWQELVKKCRWEQGSERIDHTNGFYHYHDWAICLGPNGNRIIFEKTGLYEIQTERVRTNEVLFWLKKGKNSLCNSANITFCTIKITSKSEFPGYKLPIRLVKKV